MLLKFLFISAAFSLLSCGKSSNTSKPIQQRQALEKSDPTYTPSMDLLMHDKEPLDKKQSKQREDTIFKLIRKVTAPPKDNEDIFRPASIDAVLELGKLKAVEAIPVLLQNLTSIGPLSMDDMFDYTTNFPCSAALIEIGEPAVEPCVKLLQTTPSIKERNVLLHILGKIKGNVWLIEYVGGLAEKVNPIPSQPFSDIQNRLKNRG